MTNGLTPIPGTILICTVGLPRSGKSTWAQRQRYPRVEPDAIRRALHGRPYVASAEPTVWATAVLMARSLFLACHNIVILDATSTTREQRERWRHVAETVYYQLFDADAATCAQRAVSEGSSDLVPVIEAMSIGWEPLYEDEKPVPPELIT